MCVSSQLSTLSFFLFEPPKTKKKAFLFHFFCFSSLSIAIKSNSCQYPDCILAAFDLLVLLSCSLLLMSRALPEMLHCLQTPENLSGNCMDLTVLERQRTRMKWNQQQLMPQEDTHLRIQGGFVENYSIVSETANSSVKSDPELANGGFSFENFQIPIQGFGGAELAQPPRVVVAPPEEKEIGLMKKMSCVGKENVKKRKADKAQDPKIGGAEETNEKRVKGSAAEEVANNRETSGDGSRENFKISEVQKPDFIHVRARRGQATDSHSLAERVRREKISERMKYLQDLVPGCNKIIGKAGMLDEIINYVQSLQRQVEFLSMKLAAVNPRLDFNIEDFFSKEMFPSCTNSFSTLGMLSEMVNPTYLQYNPAQQLTLSCGLDMAVVSSPEMALGRTNSTTPVLAPKSFLDSSCFSHAQTQQAVSWENDLQSIYNVAFSQDRSTAFPSQP